MIVDDIKAPRETNPLNMTFWLQNPLQKKSPSEVERYETAMALAKTVLSPMADAPRNEKIYVLVKHMQLYEAVTGRTECGTIWTVDGVLWHCRDDGWYETDDLAGFITFEDWAKLFP